MTKNEKILVPQCLSNLVPLKSGFTLAEVLITLGIIGIVAAMTIPTLVADYQERSFNTADSVFQRKLGEALKVMNSQMTLAGHTSTESFVNELKKHIKVTKTCANDKLMDCFESEVFWGSGDATPEAVDMNKIKTSKNFGQKDWQESNVIGVQFADGVSALIAYNKDAKQDPYSNQIVNISGGSDGKKGSVSLGTTALAILYDTNGYKSPNKNLKDIRGLNILSLGGASCIFEIDSICFTLVSETTTPISKTECEELKSTGKYGIPSCPADNDYWAGAIKTCGGIDKLPTISQLRTFRNAVLESRCSDDECYYNWNTTAMNNYGFNTSKQGFNIYTNSEIEPGETVEVFKFGLYDWEAPDYEENRFIRPYTTFCVK